MMYRSRIGFRFSDEQMDVFRTYNCLNDVENAEEFASCTVMDVHESIRLAVQAHRELKHISVEKRSAFLHAIAQEMDVQRSILTEVFCREASLPLARANAELDRTIGQLRNYGDSILKPEWNRPIHSQLPNSTHQIDTKLQAIGVVVVFGASNFPFAYSTAGGDTASAFAAGCPVIVKAHPMHAGTSYFVSECIVKAAQLSEMPDGVFSHLLDNGHDIGEALVRHENVKAVGFTGSIRGGRALMDLSAKRSAPIPVFAEMGSINPVVLFEDELERNLELWSDKFTASISTDAGQFCTKPGLFFVPDSEIGNAFVTELQHQLAVTEPKCHLHPQLFKHFKTQVEETFDWIPCELPYHSQPVLRVVKANEYVNDFNYYEEYFGPQAIAVQYKDLNQLYLFLNKLDGQLTATIIGQTQDANDQQELIDYLSEKAGRIILNGVSTGVSVVDAMVHGGVYPAASDSRFTAVGSQCMYRFLRPVAIQTTGKI